MTALSIVYCPFPSREAALQAARTLVSERLAACGNVFDGINSVYEWNQAVSEEREAVLLLKTRSELVSRVMSRLRELHSYDCPAILAWELTEVDPDYGRWVDVQTR